MAKAKRQARESASATLASGTKVSGPPAVVARLVARYGEEKAPAKRAAAKQSDDDK